jgi:Ala-tRNA(Pro) deacylase
MSMLRQLEEYLNEHEIQYRVLTHMPFPSAQEIAQAQHVPGKQMAKVVIVRKKNGTLVMLVLPATHKIDFARLRQVLRTPAELAHEDEFRDRFPGCEVGAEPPFGRLFGLDTIVEKALAENEEIVFNAGTHWQSVQMRYGDFERLLHPRIAHFAEHV